MPLKGQLIKLGAKKPELRVHLRPILDVLQKKTASRRTLEELQDLLEDLRGVNRASAEYIQITGSIPSYVWEEPNDRWWRTEAPRLIEEIKDILNHYGRRASVKTSNVDAFDFDDIAYMDLIDDLWREAVNQFKNYGEMSEYHSPEHLVFEVFHGDLRSGGVKLGGFVFGKDRNAYLYSKNEDRPTKVVKDTGDIERTAYKAFDEFEKIVKNNLIEVKEEKAQPQRKEKGKRELEDLKRSFKGWLKRKTDENYVNDLYEFSGGVQGLYRTWKIQKYPEDQNPRNVEKVLKTDKKDLERHLSRFKHLIERIDVWLGDKNWVDATINFKS